MGLGTVVPSPLSRVFHLAVLRESIKIGAMKKSYGLLICVVGACQLAVWAAPSFQADKSLPNLGLKIRVLGNSTPEPLPPPKVHSYTLTQGEVKTQYDMFSARELWYASQHAGQWRDKAGNVMLIARPTLQLPAARETVFSPQEDHITRASYEKAVAEAGVAFDAGSEEALTAWVASFLGVTPAGVERLKVQQNFNLTDAVFFPSVDASALAWAFRVKVRDGRGGQRASDWFVVALQLNDGSPAQKVRQEFEAQFFKSVAAVAGPSNAPGTSKELDPKPGAPSTGRVPLPGRDEAIRSIENMEGWRYAEAENYIFLTDIQSQAGKSLVKDLQNTLPVLRRAFAKLVEPFSDKDELYVVRIFESREAYVNHVGEGIEWSIGVWRPSHRELCILSQGTDSKADKEETAMIIRHEAFHQYLFSASGGIENAVWFNEGHACFFEASEIDSQRRVGVNESKQKRTLMDNLDAAAQNIPLLLAANYGQFYSGDAKQRHLNYSTAWGLIYFLRCGTSSGKTTAYAGILGNYRTALKETKDARMATEAAFKDVDMKALQSAFLDFWRKGGASKKFRVN